LKHNKLKTSHFIKVCWHWKHDENYSVHTFSSPEEEYPPNQTNIARKDVKFEKLCQIRLNQEESQVLD